MQTYKTLIILDWDDTLFPTTWSLQNNIDYSNNTGKTKKYFTILDNTLYQLLSNLLRYGQIIIITNATTGWIHTSCEFIPKTCNLIKEYINIESARDIYQNVYPDEMSQWKLLLFNDIAHRHNKLYKYQNIISIGDAKYEFDALTNLYNKDSYFGNRLLKSVRFVTTPSFDTLIDELIILNKCIDNIYKNKQHMDMMFNKL